MQTEGVEVSVVQLESREQGGEPSLREMEEGNWCIHDCFACTVTYKSHVSWNTADSSTSHDSIP